MTVQLVIQVTSIFNFTDDTFVLGIDQLIELYIYEKSPSYYQMKHLVSMIDIRLVASHIPAFLNTRQYKLEPSLSLIHI